MRPRHPMAARITAAKRRAAVRSECDTRLTASGGRPYAAGDWTHPDPGTGHVRARYRCKNAHQDPALPQSQAPQPVLCGTEGTGNRARLGSLCVPRLRAPALQTGSPSGAAGGGRGARRHGWLCTTSASIQKAGRQKASIESPLIPTQPSSGPWDLVRGLVQTIYAQLSCRGCGTSRHGGRHWDRALAKSHISHQQLSAAITKSL